MKYRTKLSVRLDYLTHNIFELKKLCRNEIIFMVKANAYGHGIFPIVRQAILEGKISSFGVASLEEAVLLRKCLSDLRFEIYVFSDTQLFVKESFQYYLDYRLIPVLSNHFDLDVYLNNSSFSYLPFVLKVNTGMNRLGVDIDEILIKKIKDSKRSISHLMSHFSSSSLSFFKNKKNVNQLDNFKKFLKTLKDENISVEQSSMANSGAIEQGGALEFSHIRPGLVLYGPSSLIPTLYEGRKLKNMKLISSLSSRVVSVHNYKKGDPIGYGASVLPRSGKMAIVAAGYGDGLSTKLQGTYLNVFGKLSQVVGRVNMDMFQLLFEDEKTQIDIGQEIKIWDHCPEEFVRVVNESESIPYEFLCHLNPRVTRVYHSN